MRYLVAWDSRGASGGLDGHRQPAAGHDTVNVRMMFQLLPPGVQDHQHPYLCSQVLGVSRHFQESLLAPSKSSRYKSSRLPKASARRARGAR